MYLRSLMAVALASSLVLGMGGCSGSGDGTEGEIAGDAATGTAEEWSDTDGELVVEFQQIQALLNTLQQEAMQDSTLRGQFFSLQEHANAAMVAIDPNVEQKQLKLQELQVNLQTAQQAGDQEQVELISAQGNALQTEMMQLQEKVFEQPELAAELETFRQTVEGRMAELDPRAPELIKRSNEINLLLQESARKKAGLP